MFTNILWATDASPEADAALHYAVEMAEHSHARLHVVHVVEKFIGGRTTGQDALLNEHEIVTKIKTQIAGVAQEHAIKPTLHVVAEAAGHVAGRISDVAQETGADLIVVGTRGRSALGALVLGSVTQRLLHVSTCPVLAVPHGAAAEADEAHEVRPEARSEALPTVS
jgi:nucleotide-binding universal stress UspA family protein